MVRRAYAIVSQTDVQDALHKLEGRKKRSVQKLSIMYVHTLRTA